MAFEYFSADHRQQRTHFDRQQSLTRELLARPEMTAYLGKLMVAELNTINDNAFLPNSRHGRAVAPRSKQNSDALAIIPASVADMKDPMALTGGLLRGHVLPYQKRPLHLPEAIPYLSPDELRQTYSEQVGSRQANLVTPLDADSHGLAVTAYVNWPEGISRPVQITRMDLPLGKMGPVAVHELIHASDALRQPSYASPHSQTERLRRVAAENRAYYGSAAALHAEGNPPLAINDTSLWLDTLRHFSSDPADPFAPTADTIRLHMR